MTKITWEYYEIIGVIIAGITLIILGYLWWKSDKKVRGEGENMNFKVGDRVRGVWCSGFSPNCLELVKEERMKLKRGDRVKVLNVTDTQKKWGIKQYTTSNDWGELTCEYPSNFWEGSASKHRNFNLNLSCFQFRIGIAYRF